MNQTTTVTVTTLDGTQLYSQTVENLNLKAVIAAVNTPGEPQKPVRKRRVDAGKSRAPKPEPAEVK